MVPLWGWAQRGQWDYTVLLKPNTVYGATTAGPGLTYFDRLVEGIEARFIYTFATDTPADFTGWYQVTSDLASGELLRERLQVVPRTPIKEEETTVVGLELEVAIDRRALVARVEEMAAEAGVVVEEEPTVTYTARVELAAAALTEGRSRQVLERSLVVPLTGETFTISGAEALNKDGVFRSPEDRPRPGWAERQRNTLVATGVAALLAPLFALVTRPGPRPTRSPEDALAKQARAIMRKYRKRLAQAAPGETDLPGGEAVPLEDMAGLARVADDLLKPIVYRPPTTAQEPHIFYIIDGATRYEFQLGAP